MYTTRLKPNEKLTIVSNLATMLSSGIPILEAVDSMLEGTKGNQKQVLEVLKNDLNQGNHIATSLEKFPNAFDPITTSLIKVAEDSGSLETTLKDLTTTIKKDMDFTNKVKGALLYPAVVMSVFAGVLLIILTFVIPRISTIFARLRLNLPLPTKILIAASNILLKFTPLVIISVIFLSFLTIYLYRTRRKQLLNFLYKLPLLSKLAREIDITRFTRSLSLLLSAGIPIDESLTLTEHLISKKEILNVLEKCQEQVTSGKKLSEGFKNSKNIIPPIMVRITEAGEKSGTLETSMQELSDYYEIQVENRLRSLTVLFEPLLLVLIGLLVGGVMLAILAPIYGLIGQIQAR